MVTPIVYLHMAREVEQQGCVTCRILLCFTGDKDCFEKYQHQNFQRHRELLAKKYQRHTQVKPIESGRPLR